MVLSSKLQDPAIRESVAADCTQLMDEQVSNKGGLGGMAMKTAYKVIKGLGSDYIPGAIKRLLPEVSTALDPIWAEGLQSGDPVAFLSQNSDRTADLILSTTDARIERKGSGVIVSTYQKLRKSVKKDVASAVPGLAQILGKYAG
ncbi:MAG: hypothetical protein AAFP03_06265 [Cyanobacteria bacterium J06598_3]